MTEPVGQDRHRQVNQRRPQEIEGVDTENQARPTDRAS